MLGSLPWVASGSVAIYIIIIIMILITLIIINYIVETGKCG